ncbi:MAG: hypothetical protein WC307_05655 [Candidatus Nanoarchaeia archaeon]|jgi:hypothetical protein
MPRFLTKKEIMNSDYMPTSIERAKKLKVRKDYETKRHVAYEVIDPVTGSNHFVFYKSEKQPPLDWVCDCEWYSTQTIHNAKYCAHIIAVQFTFS